MIALYLLFGLMFIMGLILIVNGIRNKMPWETLQQYGTDISQTKIGNRYFDLFLGLALIGFSIALFIKIF